MVTQRPCLYQCDPWPNPQGKVYPTLATLLTEGDALTLSLHLKRIDTMSAVLFEFYEPLMSAKVLPCSEIFLRPTVQHATAAFLLISLLEKQ